MGGLARRRPPGSGDRPLIVANWPAAGAVAAIDAAAVGANQPAAEVASGPAYCFGGADVAMSLIIVAVAAAVASAGGSGGL